MINCSLIWCSYNSRERFSGFALNQKYFCEETLVLLGKGKNKAVCKQSCKGEVCLPWSSTLPEITFCRKLPLPDVKNFFETSNPELHRKAQTGLHSTSFELVSFNFPPDWVEKVCGLESAEGETYWKLQSGIRLKREMIQGKSSS